MNKYKPVIGLEIHVELKTKSKMFCGCPAVFFGKKPNTQTCPVCLGLPGALPVPNRKAIDWTILIGKALNCKINEVSKFDRKHYFYPDLPKGYQISQYDEPIAIDGSLKLKIKNEKLKIEEKTFRITRVHLEEDTGKLLHVGADTLVDFNRSGVPLVEVVTEPDFDNADDVKRFLEELQVIIRYLGVSDADMEKGSMRLEPNISVRKLEVGSWELEERKKPQTSNHKPQTFLPKYKVEVKNINSFRFVKQAIEYEVERQIGILEKGETPMQETRGFDDKKGITYGQRSKEEAHDYRYFPEPDIPPMTFSKKYIEGIEVPELPNQKVERYLKLGLRYSNAFTLTRNKKLNDLFEETTSKIKVQDKIQVTDIANLLINKREFANLSSEELYRKLKELKSPKQFDEKLLDTTINQLIGVNKKAVEDYKKGKENAIMFLVGQVMGEMKGKADAKTVISKLKAQMSNPNLKSKN
ncbi:hypothetical protein A3C25_06455 [Candidatus Roizmanbacteria bacterium RIFCSPHIGHO2_02_FULL_38_11]|uniref:Aspartyl/glutamyl-tRNA(Asn/Gln) amidotransferase subunit B n=1 Tax=Candidatus Roizmanbacteria bacterium RIFCSPHIGHO2_02_FULL_38_11 TaxID=1802039 RepID=A0A1F7GWQ2_9BACT|nr:MAG: hypothetical protein A3C25_06455 [Candidatus Roizmanbacteria bacterium RIFCSPHIGHO2_02_FULL_38_11]